MLQAWLLWRLRSGWRQAAALPLAGALVYTLLAVLDGSNIFPLALIFAAPVADLYLAAIAVLRLLSRKRA